MASTPLFAMASTPPFGMQSLYLIKYGELQLKGQNRGQFERRLCANIRRALGGDAELERRHGRLLLRSTAAAPAVRRVLERTFGIVGFSRALQVDKDPAQLSAAALELAPGLAAEHGQRFKIEARRSDKSFPLDSYGIACQLGALLREKVPGLVVDLHHPGWVLNVEIRERAYLYGPPSPAPGGLPVGSSGRGLLLLSGGIDSPVAGWLLAKRGLSVDAVYFHTPPYTSGEALQKVRQLCRILSEYLGAMRLFVVPFTALQLRIRERAPLEQSTLLIRACMVRAADCLARREGHGCLISGESLGQVASQTLPSLRFTGGMTGLPLLRPLIGMDKEEIVTLARRIGTFETSVLPYPDCCTLFAPPHPLVKPDQERMLASFAALEAEELLEQALRETAENGG
jgi:thiamine biosynthesis protein ThiI